MVRSHMLAIVSELLFQQFLFAFHVPCLSVQCMHLHLADKQYQVTRVEEPSKYGVVVAKEDGTIEVRCLPLCFSSLYLPKIDNNIIVIVIIITPCNY